MPVDAARARAEAEARARAEAEARARAEAEARARAEAEARARAAAEAQKAAEAARAAQEKAAQRAAQAQAQEQKAAEDARRAQEAQAQADQARRALEAAQHPPQQPPGQPGQPGPQDVTRLRRDAEEAQQRADHRSIVAQSSARDAETFRQSSLRYGQRALDAQKKANELHVQGGGRPEEVPFRAAARAQPQDVFHAGQLSAQDQKEIFGVQPPLTPQERVKADVDSVGQATARDPAEGARVLRERVEANADPVYRDALVQGSQPHITAMAAGLANRNPPNDAQMQGVAGDLARTGEVAGPQAAARVGGAFAAGMRDLPGNGNDAFANALKNSISEHNANPAFANALRDSLQQQGNANNALAKINDAAFGVGGVAERQGFSGLLNRASEGELPSDQLLPEAARAIGDNFTSAENWAKGTFGVIGYHDDIQQLGHGDRISLGAGGQVSVEAEALGQARVDVSRTQDGKYVVSMDASAGAGIFGALGANAGPVGANLGGHLNANAGGRIELTLDNADDANRAVDTAMVVPLNAATAVVPSAAGPAVAAAAPAALGMEPQNLQWMADHTTAIEARVSAGGSGSAFAGFEAFKAFAGTGANLSGDMRGTLRLELDHGRPTNVVLRGEANLNGTVNLGAGAETVPSTKPADARRPHELDFVDAMGLAGNGSLTVRLDQRIPVRDGVTLPQMMSVMANPPSLPLAAPTMLDMSKSSARLYARAELEGNGYLFGGMNGQGVRAEMQVDGTMQDVLRSGAIDQLKQGNYGSAMSKLGDHLRLSTSVRNIARRGFNEDFAVQAFGVGFQVHAEAQGVDAANQPIAQYQGTASQGVRDLRAYLQEQVDRRRAEQLRYMAPVPG